MTEYKVKIRKTKTQKVYNLIKDKISKDHNQKEIKKKIAQLSLKGSVIMSQDKDFHNLINTLEDEVREKIKKCFSKTMTGCHIELHSGGGVHDTEKFDEKRSENDYLHSYVKTISPSHGINRFGRFGDFNGNELVNKEKIKDTQTS